MQPRDLHREYNDCGKSVFRPLEQFLHRKDINEQIHNEVIGDHEADEDAKIWPTLGCGEVIFGEVLDELLYRLVHWPLLEIRTDKKGGGDRRRENKNESRLRI